MTVKEFTGGLYNEIKVQNPQIKGSFCEELTVLLNKSGVSYSVAERFKDLWGVKDELAVMEFQKQQKIPVTGTINDTTLNALIATSKNMSDIIYSEGVDALEINTTSTDNPHYDSFFSNDNEKTMRRNRQNIVIEIGNASVVKTIHNIFVRSVNVEVDTSGNPISEVYEFIAQDITESDEPSDYGKYS